MSNAVRDVSHLMPRFEASFSFRTAVSSLRCFFRLSRSTQSSKTKPLQWRNHHLIAYHQSCACKSSNMSSRMKVWPAKTDIGGHCEKASANIVHFRKSWTLLWFASKSARRHSICHSRTTTWYVATNWANSTRGPSGGMVFRSRHHAWWLIMHLKD